MSKYQFITVRQRAACYPFVHYSDLFLCTFSVFHSSNLYFFVLHFFHVALFSYCTKMVALFCAVIFSCCTFLRVAIFLHSISYCTFTLKCFRFAFFFCRTLHMLQIFPAALCSCWTISRGVARSS